MKNQYAQPPTSTSRELLSKINQSWTIMLYDSTFKALQMRKKKGWIWRPYLRCVGVGRRDGHIRQTLWLRVCFVTMSLSMPWLWSVTRCHHWGNWAKGIQRISLYYFSQSRVNQQLSQTKKWNKSKMPGQSQRPGACRVREWPLVFLLLHLAFSFCI